MASSDQPRLQLVRAPAPTAGHHPSRRDLRRRVAVVTTYVDRWFFSTVLAGVERTLTAAGHEVLIFQTGHDWERHPVVADPPHRHGLDALVAVALPVGLREVEQWEAYGTPVVVAGAAAPDVESVHVDDRGGARLAVEHLLGLGHERIALLRTCDAGGRQWPVDAQRHEGYVAALGDAGLEVDPDLVLSCEFSARAGAAATEALLALPEPPTAVFASCDEVAFGCLQALQAAGLRVPEDVSVVGFDDHPLAEVMGLTTVNQHVELQGELAARLVLDALVGLRAGATEQRHEVTLDLVVRRTTGPVPRPTAAAGGGRGVN